MTILDIIEKKKKGLCLDKEEINFWIENMMNGVIADYQTSSLLMAIVLKGFSDEESINLTDAILHSGHQIVLKDFYDISIDKHSTGGVGDSTSFIVLPIMAALGYKSAKFSGRGLGFTGGTLDKLESIEGLNINLTMDEFFKQVDRIGLAIAGQTMDICPADKKLYALRDVTATVDSIGLIASSVMSKKLASGAKNIVLDVKYGKGAFMKTALDAEKLAELMVKIGKANKKNISAVISNMNNPLDRYIGNSLEIYGALDVLNNNINNNLAKVSLSLCESLLNSMGVNDGLNKCLEVLKNGKAKDKFIEMIKAQGGDESFVIDKEKLKESKHTYKLYSVSNGYVNAIDPIIVSKTIALLGGGREKVEDKIDLYCGIKITVSVGDYIKKGDLISEIYYNKDMDNKQLDSLLEAFRIEKDKTNIEELIYKIIR